MVPPRGIEPQPTRFVVLCPIRGTRARSDMKILFLDDMEERHRLFKIRNIGRDVTHVYNAKEAIEALNSTKFDVVSLDHDLSIDTIMLMPGEGEGSGYDVALHI